MPTNPPASQKERPISFVLDDQANGISPDWVPLIIRPEDLTRTEPARLTVHQTLEREQAGWVDDFGMGLPTVVIKGNTGWRISVGTGRDGADEFENLHEIIIAKRQRQIQRAIDAGIDPAGVKLLFVDELDNFAWEVRPTSFVLQRSKSRPLLMQYNIVLQAVSLDVEVPFKDVPVDDLLAGVESMGGVISRLKGFIKRIVSAINRFLAPIAAAIKGFMHLTAGILSAVKSVIGAVVGGIRSVANGLISMARDLAAAGRNIFNTIAAIKSLPGQIKNMFQQVAAEFNTAFCLLKNSLRAKSKSYQNYSGLYGASNCSSTTGGTPASAYANTNVFEDLRHAQPPILMTPSALGSVSSLAKSDPVTAPMSVDEIGRHASGVVTGFQGVSPDFTKKTNAISPGLLADANASFAQVKA